MNNGQNTKAFLSKVTVETKSEILESIARHYGASTEAIYDEVTDSEAEHLLDYMIEPQRSAASVIMQKYGHR